MPILNLASGTELFYDVDDFSYPWEPREAVFLLHGAAESGIAWNHWIPHLAPHYVVVRPDMRGCGRSSPMPIDHAWSLDEIGNDFIALADHLGIDRFHVVGTKIAGAIAINLHAKHRERIATLTVIASPVSIKASLGHIHAEWIQRLKTDGTESWAYWSNTGRLGKNCPPELMTGWAKLMAATDRDSLIGFISFVPTVDVRAELPLISVPTLVITSEGGYDSVEDTSAWRRRIPSSEMLVLPSDSYHVAITEALVTAEATRAFMGRHNGSPLKTKTWPGL
jgi:pimeloyl-ACP methyl ester carboxylesterase